MRYFELFILINASESAFLKEVGLILNVVNDGMSVSHTIPSRIPLNSKLFTSVSTSSPSTNSVNLSTS